ncbi:MAG: hypothetical protein IPJ26_17210 [Bacteroidetes bacterium]|nr:hypothetical protein [Bacteroidota bacterium]
MWKSYEAITKIPTEDENMKDKVTDEVEKASWLNEKVSKLRKSCRWLLNPSTKNRI